MPRSASSYSVQTPDMEDVKESVRQVIKKTSLDNHFDLHHLQGVSKLGGRLSGMASGVMSSIQVHVYDILYVCMLYEKSSVKNSKSKQISSSQRVKQAN